MARKKQGLEQAACPCGSDESYSQCCGRYLTGELPKTAEQLMRSRYTAFTLKNENYLLETWKPSSRPADLNLSDQTGIKWTGLKVIRHQGGSDEAEVEFIARYKINGKAERIHELSRFVKEQGRWLYVDGDNIT